MDRYKSFRPTGFDSAGIGADRHGIGDFYVFLGQNRDSGVLERSNFAVALKELGGESETVQIHRFGHWACGWFELILIDPADTVRVAAAEEMEAALANYPILDEEHYSSLEHEETAEYWARMSISDRVDYITRANQNAPNEWKIPVFAARRDELPEDPAGRLWERLTSN